MLGLTTGEQGTRPASGDNNSSSSSNGATGFNSFQVGSDGADLAAKQAAIAALESLRDTAVCVAQAGFAAACFERNEDGEPARLTRCALCANPPDLNVAERVALGWTASRARRPKEVVVCASHQPQHLQLHRAAGDIR